MTTPDVAGEIVAFRSWRVSLTHCRPVPARLFSLFHDTPWAPDQWTVASCSIRLDGLVPHEARGHRCGIYAALDRGHLVRQGYHDGSGTGVVVGEVALAGDVLICERGYRAEKARPLRLWVAHEDWELVRPLRDAYGIPVDLDNLLRKEMSSGHRS